VVRKYQKKNYLAIFALFFETKVKTVPRSSKIDNMVYNGTKKVDSTNKFFMGIDSVRSCIKTIKPKTVKGMIGAPKGCWLMGRKLSQNH
jgi:2-C-methyl-D-erythritol 4-phosphate cytidylyltransferase